MTSKLLSGPGLSVPEATSVTDDPLTGDRRCWPCTVANAAVGLLVGWIPVVAALVEGTPTVIGATLVWGMCVTGFTVYRLVRLGYLPLADSVAKRTGLDEHIGPELESDGDGDE